MNDISSGIGRLASGQPDPEADDSEAVMDVVRDAQAVRASHMASPQLWGFGGLHGGLTQALLVRAMQAQASNRRLVMLAGMLMKPLRGRFDLVVMPDHQGRSTESWRASAVIDGKTCASATAVFSGVAADAISAMAPSMPAAPPPQACPQYQVPTALVPIAKRSAIRPIGLHRPYEGGTVPELLAWVRLLDDDVPPDPVRLIYLMDAIAPSYSAVLSTPIAIPTVALNFCPAQPAQAPTSPWILLRASTRATTADGWIDEQLDAWSQNGAYLGSAQQRRLLLAR